MSSVLQVGTGGLAPPLEAGETSGHRLGFSTHSSPEKRDKVILVTARGEQGRLELRMEWAAGKGRKYRGSAELTLNSLLGQA